MSNLAVVGNPISHSKSPALHSAAYAALGLDWKYSSHTVEQGTLLNFVDGLNETWRGLSVTMPLKSEAFDLSASRDSHATYTEAVNTLAFSYNSGHRVIRGYNTDVYGIVSSLSARGGFDTNHASLIGGGATALSALVALKDLGFQSVSLVLRDIAKADQLIGLSRALGLDIDVVDFSGMNSCDRADVAISTIPGSAEIQLELLPRKKDAVLLDVAYDVWPSPRSISWNEMGGTSVSGLSMLAFQALKQVRIFTSNAPDEPLENEADIAQAMFASVGLNSEGL